MKKIHFDAFTYLCGAEKCCDERGSTIYQCGIGDQVTGVSEKDY